MSSKRSGKSDEFPKLIYLYLKGHRLFIAAMLLFFSVYASVLYLYELPLEAVGYATLLAVVSCTLFVLWDFRKFYLNHKKLRELKNKITISLDELPDPASSIEEDYQELIHTLYEDKFDLLSRADNKQQEMQDYFSLWTHQIKTPISAVRLLLQTEEFPNQSNFSQEIFKIERYVEMALQFLRLDSIASDLALNSCSLDKIVRQAIKKYAPVFIHKKIKLNISKTEKTVLTDEKWLTFVIEQLLSNALKYTHEGTISIYTIEESGVLQSLVIQDTGIGINPEDLPRIFEKGFTGYNGRLDKKSTGLGLYLCKIILSKLNHTISITSVPNKGTEVLVKLCHKQISF